MSIPALPAQRVILIRRQFAFYSNYFQEFITSTARFPAKVKVAWLDISPHTAASALSRSAINTHGDLTLQLKSATAAGHKQRMTNYFGIPGEKKIRITHNGALMSDNTIAQYQSKQALSCTCDVITRNALPYFRRCVKKLLPQPTLSIL